MMGRGAEGGISQQALRSDRAEHKLAPGRGMDIYSQAVKALAVKSPFGGDEAGNAGGGGSGFSGPLVKLPSSADPKRKNRARKTQAVSKKREFGDIDDGNPKMFWVQMEDYFREVIAEDVKLLFPRTSFGVIDSTLAQDPCFNVRPRGRRYLDIWAEEDRKYRLEAPLESQQSARGIKRKLLTASPVSKRKKTSSVSADTITTVISPSAEAEEDDVCHVCNSGDSEVWNQIIMCDTCNVAVHQDCYGVQNIPEGQWLCSWCAYRQDNGSSEHGSFNCVLCPCSNGALKPASMESNSPSKQVRFAHLFCTQWVPETFLQDTVAMEPVKNVEGIREERWRLICVVCKEKHGACIQCSHGLCATPFHPLCARDAKLWMEVSSRDDTDDVDLRAYCPKHSATRIKPSDPVASKECLDDKVVSVVVTENPGNAGQAMDTVSKDNVRVEVAEFHHEEKSPVDEPLGEMNQEQLVTNLKQVIQNHGISMDRVASEAGVPQSSLLLWLEGKLHEGESKINSSICAWLCAYSSLLKCSASASAGDQSNVKLKRNGYSDRNKEKEVSPSRIETPESTAKFSTGPVKINCQLLQVEEDFGSFGDEADDRTNIPSVSESQKPMIVMQNETRLFDNDISNGLFESDSPCQEANSPLELEESVDSGETDKQLYVIPGIMKRLLPMQPNSSTPQTLDCSFSGQEELECSTSDRRNVEEQWQQLRRAKNSGVLDLCPQDEMEAEIFVLQNQLIDCSLSNRAKSEKLIARILCKLSKERQSARKQLQDLLIVNQFLADAKEARKQGRKEKKDREAQANLAAATAAAAASPRTGYVKRDIATHDDSYYPSQDMTAEYKLNHGNPHSPYVRPFRPPVPKPPKLNVSSSFRVQPTFYRHEDQYACDVCSSNESLRLNRIVHCKRCNVAVHQDCYGIRPFPSASWYCQPCTELHQQPVKLAEDGDRIAPGVHCALCPNPYGAFKKSSDGRWVHVFCALWVPKTTFGREQSSPIGGLEAVPTERFNLTCTICQQQQGACIKCNSGHCNGAFHPMCARDAGLYISARNVNGRALYKAFCERHSPQQRTKYSDFVSQAEPKQYGSPDEINALRQIRVEFERVRLICERICKRERIKRELTHCIKDLYINQLVAVIGGHSVDQAANNQRAGEGNGPLYSDSLLDVPWTAESRLTEPIWPAGRNSNNVKELKAERNTGDSVKDQKRLRKYNRHSEPLGREKIMTPSEASMHNKLLPKGYAYVPVNVLERGALLTKQQEQADQQQPLQQQTQQQQQHQDQDRQHKDEQQQQQQQQENDNVEEKMSELRADN